MKVVGWFHKSLIQMCFVIGVFFFSQASIAKTQTFKIATLTPDGSTWMKLMRASAKEIEEKTAGRVKFKFYPAGVMGDDKAVLRKMRIGQLHGAAVTGGAFDKIYPDSQIYGFPLAFDNFEQVDYVRSRMDKILIQGFEDNDFVTFGFAEGGLAYPMTKAEPIIKPDDFLDHKVWVPADDEMSVLAFSAIDVTPIPLPLGDVMAGLQTGLVDTIASPPVPTLVMQWHSQVTSVTDMPISYIYGLLVISKKVFSKMSAEDQALVRAEMTKVFKELDEINRKDSINAFSALQAQGVELAPISPEIQKEWQQLAIKARNALKEKGIFSDEIITQFETLLEEAKSVKK